MRRRTLVIAAATAVVAGGGVVTLTQLRRSNDRVAVKSTPADFGPVVASSTTHRPSTATSTIAGNAKTAPRDSVSTARSASGPQRLSDRNVAGVLTIASTTIDECENPDNPATLQLTNITSSAVLLDAPFLFIGLTYNDYFGSVGGAEVHFDRAQYHDIAPGETLTLTGDANCTGGVPNPGPTRAVASYVDERGHYSFVNVAPVAVDIIDYYYGGPPEPGELSGTISIRLADADNPRRIIVAARYTNRSDEPFSFGRSGTSAAAILCENIARITEHKRLFLDGNNPDDLGRLDTGEESTVEGIYDAAEFGIAPDAEGTISCRAVMLSRRARITGEPAAVAFEFPGVTPGSFTFSPH
jgi:hypothetical protein